jgi:DNA-binding NtrC family response regulator
MTSAALVARPRLILIGLEESLSAEIVRHLPDCRALVFTGEDLDEVIHHKLSSADMIFCQTGDPALAPLLASARAFGVPVVVVAEHPEVEQWLNAMDAGAADYAAPPFSRKQMSWILNANLRKNYGSAISVNSSSSTAPQASQTSAPSWSV